MNDGEMKQYTPSSEQQYLACMKISVMSFIRYDKLRIPGFPKEMIQKNPDESQLVIY